MYFLWFPKWGQQIAIHNSCFTSFLGGIRSSSQESWFPFGLMVKVNYKRYASVIVFKTMSTSINIYFFLMFLKMKVFKIILVYKNIYYIYNVQCSNNLPYCCLHTCSYILFSLFISYLNPRQWKYLAGHLYSEAVSNSVNRNKEECLRDKRMRIKTEERKEKEKRIQEQS